MQLLLDIFRFSHIFCTSFSKTVFWKWGYFCVLDFLAIDPEKKWQNNQRPNEECVI